MFCVASAGFWANAVAVTGCVMLSNIPECFWKISNGPPKTPSFNLQVHQHPLPIARTKRPRSEYSTRGYSSGGSKYILP